MNPDPSPPGNASGGDFPTAHTRPPPQHLVRRLTAPGPKRILALDGGGIRGVISLRFLKRIEAILREESGDPDLVLADYFDLIGGTSTGAILATALSLGWSVERVAGMYREMASEIFRPRRAILGSAAALVGARYDQRPLEAALRKELGDLRLDSPELRTGLVVIAKRADTASVWQLTNVPGHRFYGMNRHLLLRELVRASSAAPTFFDPQRISDVGEGQSAIFVDGGVSMHTNPALQLLMVANLAGFGLRWPLGEHSLLLCSVGTGAHLDPPAADTIRGYRQLQWLSQLMVHLLRDASDLGEMLLQWISTSPTARSIDRQVGDLAEDLMGPEPLLSYLRYDIPLERDSLAGIGFDPTPAELAGLRSLAGHQHIPLMERVGESAARLRVDRAHFQKVFSPWPTRPRSGGPVLGVTGHRAEMLKEIDPAGMGRAIDGVLSGCRGTGIDILLSPLAEGADRLVARRALTAGWVLRTIFPFEVDRYEGDFASEESRGEFRALAAQAASTAVVTDDGKGDLHVPYRRVGEALLDGSDLLLAIWDGEPARGPGGTAEVVEGALARGVPVVWVHSEPPHQVRILEPGRRGARAVPEPIGPSLPLLLHPWVDNVEPGAPA